MKISASSRSRKRQEVLEEGLGRLHKLLAELMPSQRLTALQFFSESLRSALLRYMELRHLHRSTDATLTHAPSAQQSKPRKRKATVDAAKTRPNSLKGVSMIKTKDGHRRYFARAIISGIAISSRCVRSREEAQVLRAQLEQVSLLHRGEKHDSQLELAFDKFQEHMWLFRATVDARRFLGKTLSSRQVSSIRQALAMKQNLDEARQQGWPVLRASWVQSMQEPRGGRFGHRSLSAEEADAMCKEAEAKAEHCPRVRLKSLELPSRSALAAQLRAERIQRATLARQKQLQRLAMRLERTLKAIRGQA